MAGEVPMAGECDECQAEAATLSATRGGDRVCDACAAAYYVVCEACHLLVPRDETREADGVHYCADCFVTTFGPGGFLTDEDIDELVAEYIRLDAEAKALGERLDALKDHIKAVAATRERVSGTVMLGRGETRVTCSYSTSYRSDPERAAALEAAFGADVADALFERKLSVNRAGVERVLASRDPADADLRIAVVAAVDAVETPRITVPRRPKGKAEGGG
jgi:hypothetical protein